MSRRLPVSAFFALFTVSGFAGLIYESLWSHYLKLFLGHAAYAQTLVLAIFMGGMAAGAWLVSRATGRLRNLLLGYAAAEVAIGLMALVFHRGFVATTDWAYDVILPALHGAGVDAFKWSLGALLILPASVLLGTTFPLMSGALLRRYPESAGRSLAMLYFTNSFGAAAGVLASGFFLIDRFGLPGAIMTAGLLNVALGLGVYLIARSSDEPPAAAAVPDAGQGGSHGNFARLVLAVALATGTASFIYEIAWIRMLTLGLGASTQAFEVMLAAFILAMSLGAFAFRNRIQRIGDDRLWLAGVLLAKAVCAVYAIWAYDSVLDLLAWLMGAVGRNERGHVLMTLAGLGASMLVMFPAAFLAGVSLPLATHALTRRGFGEASIGRVYAANTTGCIVGAAFATHLGMPLLGLKGLTGLGGVLDATAGMALLAFAGGWRETRLRSGALAAAAVAALALFFAAPLDLLRMSSGVYRHGEFLRPEVDKLLFYRDGKTATVAIIESDSVRSIRTNGKSDASVMMQAARGPLHDEHTMIVAGLLPLAVRPDARDVANIGFGSGLTTHLLLGSPRLQRVDSIEIEPLMVEGARHFQPRNARAYDDPRSHMHIEDAKTFFASAGRTYDVIVSEPSNPWVSGVSTLFSVEYYRRVRHYLRPDGLLVQWVQAYDIDLPLLGSIFRALESEFGDYTVYRTGSDLLVLATPAPALPPLRPDVFAFPALQDDLRHLGYRSTADLEALRLGGRSALSPLFAATGYQPNSDFFPVLDQRAPGARFRNASVMPLVDARDLLAQALPLLDRDVRLALPMAVPGPRTNTARLRAAAGAEGVRLAMTGESGPHRVLAPVSREQDRLVHVLARGCAGAEDDWLHAVGGLAVHTVPNVRAADVAPMLETLANSPCARTLDATGRAFLTWLAAVNARDAAAIGRHADTLLAARPPWLGEVESHVRLSAMAAAVALGDAQRALALHAAVGSRLPPDPAEAMAWRLVLAHARRAKAQ